MEISYEFLLKETYIALINRDIHAIREIENVLCRIEHTELLTKAQKNYIFNKIQYFTNYWYEEVLYNVKSFKAFDNKYKLDSAWISIICMYIRYSPPNPQNTAMIRYIIDFLKHNKHKLGTVTYKRCMENIITSSVYQLNSNLKGNQYEKSVLYEE